MPNIPLSIVERLGRFEVVLVFTPRHFPVLLKMMIVVPKLLSRSCDVVVLSPGSSGHGITSTTPAPSDDVDDVNDSDDADRHLPLE